MDAFSLQIEKLNGLSSKSSAASIFSRRITFGEENLGTVVSLVSVRDCEEEDAQVLITDIFEIAGRKLEGTSEGLLAALTAASDASIDYIKARSCDVSFGHLVFYKNVVYVAKSDEGIKVFVCKLPKISQISFGSGSGPLSEGQIYLLATDKFVESFAPESFLKSEQVGLEEIIDELATEISSKEDSSQMAAAVVAVKGEGASRADDVKKSTPRENEDKKVIDEGEINSFAKDGKVEVSDEETIAVTEDAAGGRDEAAFVQKAQEDEDKTQDGTDRLEKPDVSDVEQETRDKAGFKNPAKGILKAIFSELKKIGRGDGLAILRLRRNLVLVALIFLIILGASGALTIKNKRDKEVLEKFDNYVLAASAKYDEAVAILDLNKSRAREILVEAETEVGRAIELKPKDSRVLDLKNKISTKLKESENLSKVEFKTLIELSSDVVSLTGAGKNLAAFTKDEIVEFDKSGEKVDETGTEGAVSRGFVFDKKAFYLGEGGIERVDLASDKSEEVGRGSGSDLAVFVGNIYILASDQIHKYVPIEGGYSQSADYLSAGESFEGNSRFAIDGSIWVTKGSSVLNYLRGERQSFEISALSSSPGKFGEIYTNSDSDNIYVVDVGNSALLVIGKDGIYKRAYQAGEFAKVSDVVVDEAAGKMYLAVGNKILEADL